MSRFKLISGSLEQLKGLRLTSTTPSANEGVILNEDLPRTAYYSDKKDITIQSIKDKLWTIFQEKKDTLDYAYTQGDLTGGSFSLRTLRTKGETGHTFQSRLYELNGPLYGNTDFFEDLNLNFMNDKGVFCGMTLQLVRDDSNTEIPVEERPFEYGITVVENVLGAMSERQITYITHQSLSNPDFKTDDLDSVDDVHKTIEAALKSKVLFSVMKPILKADGFAALPEFQLLKASVFKTNENIFTRIKQLSDSYESSHIDPCSESIRFLRMLNDDKITSVFMGQEDATKNDEAMMMSLSRLVDQKENVGDIKRQLADDKLNTENDLKLTYNSIKEAQSKQSYFRRHIVHFAQITVSALVVGLITAALVLSPLGVLATPILAATVAVLVTASLAGIMGYINLIASENSLMNYLQDRDQRQQKIRDNSNQVGLASALLSAEERLSNLKREFITHFAKPQPKSVEPASHPSPLAAAQPDENNHAAQSPCSPPAEPGFG